jgi:hypothetical protein
MNLEKINTQTTWEAAVGSINGNHSKINEAVIRLENATYKNKGYYRSLDELESNVPVPSNGSKAYVGNKYPYRIYISNNGAWMDSGETGGDENIDLDRIYVKDDIIDLPQAEFDELYRTGQLDYTKEYNTY